MRLSEVIIIYLAVAAPFGVAYFQRQAMNAASFRQGMVTTALGAALAWPLVAILFLILRTDFKGGVKATDEACADAQYDARIRRARSTTFDTLLRVEESFYSARGKNDGETRHAFFTARESVERFAGLTLAAAGAELNASPTPRELEISRLSGGTGEDLLLAGRCLHRRNVVRMRLQRERARMEMLHALAEVRERASVLPLASPVQIEAARGLSEKILEAYSNAIDLLTLLDDSRAALCVGRLLDAECARLRKLERRLGDMKNQMAAPTEEDTCLAFKAHNASATRTLSKTRTRP